MKKFICLALALLLVFGLAACKKKGEQTTAPTQAAGDVVATSIAKTVLVDDENVKVTAVSLIERDMAGMELKMEIQNKTDKKIGFRAVNIIINNYSVSGQMYVDLDANATATENLLVTATELDKSGITTVASIEMNFQIQDKATWKTTLIKPEKLLTSAAEGFNYTYTHDGVVIHADQGVKIVAKTPIKQGDLRLYIYNGSEKNIAVEIKECKINGKAISPDFSKELSVGRHVVTDIVFMEEILEEVGVTEFENIEVQFSIFNGDDYELIADTNTVMLVVEK